MRITKTFEIEMVVTESLPAEDMDILSKVFCAEVVQDILKQNIHRPHYVKYRVEEKKEEAKVGT